jgi:HD superfamily phosphodiesterase
LLYHNIEHTEFVVQKTYEIASNYSFDEKEIFILSAAAWFHDTGQLFGEPKQH